MFKYIRWDEMRKFKIILLISVVFILSSSILVVNAADIITKTEEFTSESKEPEYDKFEKTIKTEGETYQLKNIDYDLLSTDKKTEDVDRETMVTKNNLSDRSYRVGQTDTITVDGKSYSATLIDVQYETIMKQQRYGEVSGTKEYGLQTSKPSPPDTISLPYYDADTGKNYIISAPMMELKTTSSIWQDFTYIDIVVSNYTDNQFVFNGNVIKHNGNSVLPSNYYSELLSMAGFNDNTHKISNISWSGGAYKSGSVTYRNARANIQAYASSYTAYYYKRFELEDAPSYNAKLKYKYKEENVIKTVYNYKATASYELMSKEESTKENVNETVEQETTNAPFREYDVEFTVKAVTTISLLLAMSLAVVLLVMFLLAKLKLRKADRVKK